jgi:hypothetical protein
MSTVAMMPKISCLVLFLLFFLEATHAVTRQPPRNRGEFSFVPIQRMVPRNLNRPSVLVLPVVSDLEDKTIETRAYEQIVDFFRRYNYLVPSFLETRLYLKQQEIGEQAYEGSFEELSKKYRTRYVVLLKIQDLQHSKTVNPIGLITSRSIPRASLTAAGRKAHAEYILKIYGSAKKEVFETSIVANKRDPLLGFWRSSQSLALKLQKEVLSGLLDDFATKNILRAEGYILTPLKTYHPDSKGFQ